MLCWELLGLANTAYLKGFLFSGLPRVAPYCIPGGIRVVSTCPPNANYSECYERPEDTPDDAVRSVVPYLGFVNARGQPHLSCLPLTFSREELFFSVPFSPDSPFLVVVSAFVLPLWSVE